MSAILIIYLISVAIAFPSLLGVLWRAWADDGEDARVGALIIATMVCWAGPAVLLGLAGVRLATLQVEPRHVRRARKGAEAAEYLAREAEAIAAREHALGLP